MTITLIGCGCGSLTREAEAAIRQAGLLVGSARLLETYGTGKRCAEAVTAQAIAAALEAYDGEAACVLFSGDSGFYSGARLLLPLLAGRGVRVLPGISSVQALAAALGESWQDWRLCSAHGVDCDPVEEVCHGRKAFFLTGGKQDPAALCHALAEAGLGFLGVAVGEELGTERERIVRSSAEQLQSQRFDPLSVMLAEAAPCAQRRAPGWPDDSFLRAEGVPMTKQEVRAAAIARLGVRPEDTCWDIGAGTGSVGIELSMLCRRVYAVERDAAALAAAAENRRRLGAWKLRLIPGQAPEALKDLLAPDAVFVGGSGGHMKEILCAVHSANPAARVCVSAVTLEGLHNAYTTLRELEMETEVTQISVSRSREAGELTMMLAQNSVYLIAGRAP
ncbi:MAG: precorrin-6y C5,15-methyltransferase (decarboxylating) subunit CbiE [Oscillospiraceae bacterium]|nr:precorrin-6y C5,15-methyltransferase (decarboxylating) subunit CbiE [Oscillospiraceae bacterium]